MAGNRKVIAPDGNGKLVLLSSFLSPNVYNVCVLGTDLGLDKAGQFFFKKIKTLTINSRVQWQFYVISVLYWRSPLTLPESAALGSVLLDR